MKRFAVGVTLGIVSSWAVAVASSTVNHNGNFWNKLNNAAKGGYINGYSDAMRVSVGKLEMLNSAAHLFHSKGAHRIIQHLAGQLSIGEMTTEKALAAR